MPMVSIRDIAAMMFVAISVYLYLIQLARTIEEKKRHAIHNGKGAKLPGIGMHLSLAKLSLNPTKQI